MMRIELLALLSARSFSPLDMIHLILKLHFVDHNISSISLHESYRSFKIFPGSLSRRRLDLSMSLSRFSDIVFRKMISDPASVMFDPINFKDITDAGIDIIFRKRMSLKRDKDIERSKRRRLSEPGKILKDGWRIR